MRAGPCESRYLVPDEDEPDVVLSVDELGGVVGDAAGGGAVAGGTVVGGEADGVRSAGRSLIDPVPLSVQPAARVATSARAERPSNAFFMNAPPHLESNGG